MDERKNTPHPVHVISNAAFGRVFHKHSIVLEGLVRFKTETDVWRTFYRKIEHIGKSIWPMWQNQTKRKPTCVSKTKQNYLLVLTRCAELMSFEDVILVKPDDAEVEADDFAVLLLAVHRDNGASDDNLCTLEHIILAGKAKQSIRDKEGKKHHGSGGKEYGFGLVGKFKKLEDNKGMSYGEYAIKNTKQASEASNKIREIVRRELVVAVKTVESVIPRVYTTTSIAVSALVENSRKAGELTGASLAPDLLHSEEGNFCAAPVLSGYFNVDATTKVAHTECDVSYTIITVPKQNHLTPDTQFVFQFMFDETNVLNLALEEGTTLLYSGFL